MNTTAIGSVDFDKFGRPQVGETKMSLGQEVDVYTRILGKHGELVDGWIPGMVDNIDDTWVFVARGGRIRFPFLTGVRARIPSQQSPHDPAKQGAIADE
jgi:hypothetical protein